MTNLTAILPRLYGAAALIYLSPCFFCERARERDGEREARGLFFCFSLAADKPSTSCVALELRCLCERAGRGGLVPIGVAGERRGLMPLSYICQQLFFNPPERERRVTVLGRVPRLPVDGGDISR